jgi:hypothetical protein
VIVHPSRHAVKHSLPGPRSTLVLDEGGSKYYSYR